MASVTTRDHAAIQAWARTRGACPAVLSRAGGLLRFEFGPPPAAAAQLGWEEFFRVFDAKGLQLVYDDKPGSRFHKLVYPEGETAARPKPALRRSSSRRAA
ncbi:MAG TPA: hypothetical protein VMV31_06810 [Terriglobales bacterium]|nr:hypothetical protein [Terriglobales bacterium]